MVAFRWVVVVVGWCVAPSALLDWSGADLGLPHPSGQMRPPGTLVRPGLLWIAPSALTSAETTPEGERLGCPKLRQSVNRLIFEGQAMAIHLHLQEATENSPA